VDGGGKAAWTAPACKGAGTQDAVGSNAGAASWHVGQSEQSCMGTDGLPAGSGAAGPASAWQMGTPPSACAEAAASPVVAADKP